MLVSSWQSSSQNSLSYIFFDKTTFLCHQLHCLEKHLVNRILQLFKRMKSSKHPSLFFLFFLHFFPSLYFSPLLVVSRPPYHDSCLLHKQRMPARSWPSSPVPPALTQCFCLVSRTRSCCSRAHRRRIFDQGHKHERWSRVKLHFLAPSPACYSRHRKIQGLTRGAVFA